MEKAIDYPQWLFPQMQLEEYKVQKSEELTISDFVGHSDRLLSKVGIGFGVTETHHIQLAIKKLADRHQVQGSIRFWGKIFTQMGDYLIVEARSKKEISPDIEPSSEQLGEGVNYNTYWVAQSACKGVSIQCKRNGKSCPRLHQSRWWHLDS